MGGLPREEGFSLVELMVVILIVGVLLLIALPLFHPPKASVQKQTCFSNQRTIEGALESHRVSTGDYPAAISAGTTAGDSCVLVTCGYIRKWPVCPLAGTASTSTYAYGYDGSGNVVLPTGDLNCSGTHGLYR